MRFFFWGFLSKSKAVIAGEYEAAAILLAAGAMDLRDGRGVTAAEVAEALAVPDFVAEGLQGRPAECRRILALSAKSSAASSVKKMQL